MTKAMTNGVKKVSKTQARNAVISNSSLPERNGGVTVKDRADLKPREDISEIVTTLVHLQRRRSVVLKSRNMQANRLQAVIAGTLGYSSGMEEADRKKLFVEASAVIKEVQSGENNTHPMTDVIRATMIGIDSFEKVKDDLEEQMETAAATLPTATWAKERDQRGFGVLFLAIVLGETGDLSNYANPAKVWRRLGCAPWSFKGETLMGSTWRSRAGGKGRAGAKGTKLPSEEWEAFGYSPRRRSIAYLIGKNLMMQNFLKDKDTKEMTWVGPYRQRYEEAKARFKETHPDATPLHCDRHGLLLAAKLLLKKLWCVWNDKPVQ